MKYQFFNPGRKPRTTEGSRKGSRKHRKQKNPGRKPRTTEGSRKGSRNVKIGFPKSFPNHSQNVPGTVRSQIVPGTIPGVPAAAPLAAGGGAVLGAKDPAVAVPVAAGGAAVEGAVLREV